MLLTSLCRGHRTRSRPHIACWMSVVLVVSYLHPHPDSHVVILRFKGQQRSCKVSVQRTSVHSTILHNWQGCVKDNVEVGEMMNWTSGSVSATMRAEKTVPCLQAQCAQKEGC